MNLKPVEDKLIVRPVPAETVTASGIVLPDAAQEKPAVGDVVAVGPGRYSEHLGRWLELPVAVGDRVHYSRYAGAPVECDGTGHLILRRDDVLAIDDTPREVH